MALVLNDQPTVMQRSCTVVFEISNTLVTPTIGNTTIVSGGNNLIISNVHDIGSGNYLLVARFPRSLPLLHDVTGYVWTITSGGDTVNTSSIELQPEPGRWYVNLVNPTTSFSLLTGYTDHTAVTGDQLVYTKEAFPEGIPITVQTNSIPIYNETRHIESSVYRYVVESSGVVHADEKFTSSLSMSFSIDDTNSLTEGNQVISGTCSKLHSDCQFTIDGTNTYNTVNVNANWSLPTSPEEIDPYVAVPSNDLVGTSGAYVYDHRLFRLSNGNIMMVYRVGSSHADNAGYLQRIISTDEGETWGSAITIADDATYDTRNTAGGVDPTTGRIVIFYRVYAVNLLSTVEVQYITSDDDGDTWSLPTNITTALTPFNRNGLMMPWGDMVETSTGLKQLFYSYDVCVSMESTDNGLTWQNAKCIYSGTNITTGFVEPTIIRLDNNRYILYVRKQGDGLPNFAITSWCVSDDGAETFTSPTENEVFWTSGDVNSPATTNGIKIQDQVWIAWGARLPISEILSVKASVAHAFYAGKELLDENFPTRRVVFKSDTNDTGSNIDFGMPHLLELTGVDYTCLMAWYNNPNTNPNTDMAEIWVGTDQRL